MALWLKNSGRCRGARGAGEGPCLALLVYDSSQVRRQTVIGTMLPTLVSNKQGKPL